MARALDDGRGRHHPGFVAVAGVRNRRTPRSDSSRCHPLGHAAGKRQDPRLLKFIAIYQGSEEVRATLRRL